MAAMSGRHLRSFLRTAFSVTLLTGAVLYTIIVLSDTSLILSRNNLQRKFFDNRENAKVPEDLKYRWLVKRNFLPNFYTRSTDQPNFSRWPPDQIYANSTIVFVHNQKSGGSTAKNCLKDIMKFYGHEQPLLAANPNAEEFFAQMLKDGPGQDLARSYMGDSTFGICDFTDKPCSYFTVLRDPYERVISSHNMCKLTEDQAQCIVRNATELSLKEWALHQGSFFFRQLLANPLFFTKEYTKLIDKLRGPEDPPTEKIPPWWRIELILNKMMDEKQKMVALQYILDNLESWFAVIGLTDEYDTNLILFERAFGLPFYSRCAGDMSNKRQYKLAGQNPQTSRQDVVAQLHRELNRDPDVNRALYYDVKIYRKARDIFQRQKTAFNLMLDETAHF
ncbi:uncharacterized protein [Ptychodera flava]|uniref:uncharacterized protein n=1 Tax=Ptychodera flava TaxID=63121 RepID=UPI003969DBEE